MEFVWPPFLPVAKITPRLPSSVHVALSAAPLVSVEQLRTRPAPGGVWASALHSALSAVCFLLSARLQRLRLREAHQRQVHPGLLVPPVVHVQELHHGDDLPQQHWVSRWRSGHSHTPTFVTFIAFGFNWKNVWYYTQRQRLWHITAAL